MLRPKRYFLSAPAGIIVGVDGIDHSTEVVMGIWVYYYLRAPPYLLLLWPCCPVVLCVLWVYCGWLSLPFPPITARPGSTSGKVTGVRRSIYLTYLGPQASTYTETIPEIMDVNILLWRHLRPAVYYYHYYYSNPDG